MQEIPLGARGEVKLLVTSEVAIQFMGVEEARVLSTPNLVHNLEMACYWAMKPYLEQGYDSVGTEVNIRHLGAVPIGMTVTFRAEAIQVRERRVSFKVEAFDETEKVAEGTHERFIVNVARFAGRLQEKSSRR